MNDSSTDDYRTPSGNVPNKFTRLVCRLEELFFAVILLAVVGLGLAPIILRIFFQTGVTWAEPLTRQLVLWIALFGAAAATLDRKHISIDVIGHMLPKRWKTVQSLVTSTLAASVCTILAWLSAKFVREEARYTVASTIFLSVPEWIFELVMPIGFILLAVRFISVSVNDARCVIHDFRKSG